MKNYSSVVHLAVHQLELVPLQQSLLAHQQLVERPLFYLRRLEHRIYSYLYAILHHGGDNRAEYLAVRFKAGISVDFDEPRV